MIFPRGCSMSNLRFSRARYIEAQPNPSLALRLRTSCTVFARSIFRFGGTARSPRGPDLWPEHGSAAPATVSTAAIPHDVHRLGKETLAARTGLLHVQRTCRTKSCRRRSCNRSVAAFKVAGNQVGMRCIGDASTRPAARGAQSAPAPALRAPRSSYARWHRCSSVWLYANPPASTRQMNARRTRARRRLIR